MDWTPISEVSLWDKINAAENRMNSQLAKLWDAVRFTPEKWSEKSYGDLGGGFWVVAIIGKTVIWYNDIEEGFNRSRYLDFGTIAEYWCNQDELEEALQQVLNVIETGRDSEGRRGPPIAGEFVKR